MKIGRQFMFAASLLMSVSLTGCSSSGSMRLPYESVAQFDIPMSVSAKDSNTAEFISNQLCIVPDGEDKGGDDAITGISSLLFDITNKKVIYADNVYERIYPASLTKLLTALVVLEQSDLTDTVTVSYNASHIQEAGAKLCGLREGDKINLGDLLTSLLIYSGNDAGIAIAEHVAGSEKEFCKLMNEKAASIGAVDTHFTNSHGLHDENHYTTAYDLYLIFNALLEHDEAKEIITKASFTLKYQDADGNDKESVFYNTNKYLKGDVTAPDGLTVEGGKTGTTNAAGYCLEVLVENEQGNDYIAMVMKASSSDSLYSQMNELMKKID